MLTTIRSRISSINPDLLFFLLAGVVAAFSGSLLDATFNNYLHDTFAISSLQRTIIEVPREIPGLLVMFVSALFFFLCSKRLAALAMLLCGIGLALIGTLDISLNVMLCWLFILSVGQHLLIPLSSSIGMELAREGKTGRRLGQLNSARTMAGVVGSFTVMIGFKYLHFSFSKTFIAAAAGSGIAALLIFKMKKGTHQPVQQHLRLHREYRLFYWLSILFGTRKQIFLTFAPWVLVSVYKQPVQIIATLLTIGGICGIAFQPLLGKMIDSLGERFVLTGEAVVLIAVCLLYGFAGSLFPPKAALIIVAACYVTDQLLMSVGMARATYLKKIATDPSHITPALAASTSLDHVFSISTALAAGVIWKLFGYQFVFVLGAGIALVNVFSAMHIVLPGMKGSGKRGARSEERGAKNKRQDMRSEEFSDPLPASHSSLPFGSPEGQIQVGIYNVGYKEGWKAPFQKNFFLPTSNFQLLTSIISP